MVKTTIAHWIGGNVEPILGLDAVKDLKKSLPFPVIESK
jgi:hypothetical protein